MKSLLTAEHIVTALLLLPIAALFVWLSIRIIKNNGLGPIRIMIAAMLATLFTACNPNDQLLQNDQADKAFYFVSLVNKDGDTTYLPGKRARVETISLDSASDAKLKAVLLSYNYVNGAGVYMLQVTNITTCQQIIRWSWEGGFKIDSIGYPAPSTGPNDPQNDVLKAGETKLFTIYGPAKTGKLKLKAESACGNSSTLIINITTAILPITYANYTITEKDGRSYINFDVEHPEQLALIVIEKQVGDNRELLFTVPGGENLTHYSIPLPKFFR